MTLRFGEPVVEAHPRAVQVGFDPVHDPPRGQRADLFGALRGQIGEPIAVLAQDLLGQLDDVLAAVVVFAELGRRGPSACW